jgi:hypothetical protein
VGSGVGAGVGGRTVATDTPKNEIPEAGDANGIPEIT